jgi:hypothetical protein
MSRIFKISAVIIFISFSGCSLMEQNIPLNDDGLQISDELKFPKGLDLNEINKIGQELNLVLGKNQNLDGSFLSLDYSDPEIERILTPLVENGRSIHRHLLSQVFSSSVAKTLSEEERGTITNLSDQELVELSLMISILQQTTDKSAGVFNNSNHRINEDVDWDRIRSCASGVLGVGVISELVKNTAALASAEVAAEILILVGKRTLGWVALGLAVWDFYDCLN